MSQLTPQPSQSSTDNSDLGKLKAPPREPPRDPFERYQEALNKLEQAANNSLAIKAPYILFPDKKDLARELPQRLEETFKAAREKLNASLPSASHPECESIIKDAIILVAELLKEVDGHTFTPLSFTRNPAAVKLAAQCPLPTTTFENVKGLIIACVKVPAFEGRDPNEMTAYFNSLRECLKKAEQENVDGYIIDLRNNTGGNMWPMYSGLLPLLGTGDLSFFVRPNANSRVNDLASWEPKSTRDEIIKYPSERWEKLEQIKAELRESSKESRPKIDKPVAVWQDGDTASSGEQTLLLFRSRTNCVSLGATSWGATTVNTTYSLLGEDYKFVINIAQAITRDRSGTDHYEKVQPDIACDPSDKNGMLERTADWIASL